MSTATSTIVSRNQQLVKKKLLQQATGYGNHRNSPHFNVTP